MNTKALPLFLDTTIQVDRLLEERNPQKRQAIEEIISHHDSCITASFSRLEYKRVVLQNLALCLRYLVEEKSFLLAMKRAVSQSQYSRRASTLISVLSWLGFQITDLVDVEAGGRWDERLALKCESYVRLNMFYLWARFDKSVDSVVDGLECARAREGPTLAKSGKVQVEIPESRCRKIECNNANFFRSRLPAIKTSYEQLVLLQERGTNLSQELLKAIAELRHAMADPDRLYDYDHCLNIADIWIHLECLASGIKDFATTNYKESQYLCHILDLRMVQPGVASV